MFNLFVTRCRALLSDPATLPGELDWNALRAPLSDAEIALQSETHEWLRRMPRWLHPTQLCRHYPRIANRIARTWADAPQVARLLSDLMIDRRGNRHGFVPRIQKEIERLNRHNAERMNPLLRRPPLVTPHAHDAGHDAEIGLTLAVRPLRR